jgi:hypothetical protein
MRILDGMTQIRLLSFADHENARTDCSISKTRYVPHLKFDALLNDLIIAKR